jgi:SAM-dependent MidA family methyltransferase
LAEPSAGDPRLLSKIRGLIRASGPISFARFMRLCLNDPDGGYYARGAHGLGRRGDFFTASDVGTAFGETIARQLAEMDALLGSPDPFRYVEFGAGRGLLARDVLDTFTEAHGNLADRVTATLADESAGMRAEASALVPEASVVAPADVREGGAGCVVAVELFDALPVHRVRRIAGALREVRVGLDGEALVEIECVAPPEVLHWAERYGAAPEEGDEAEVALEAGPCLTRLAAAVTSGFLIVVDYGDTVPALYDRGRRRGTLLAYHRHTAGEEFLTRVGEQDLTAHVNLTALHDAAVACGLTALGVTTQDRFLIANGLLDGLDAEGADVRSVRRRLRAKQLIHPDGMGRAFKVAVFAKGFDAPPALTGLRDPFPRA